MTSPDQDRGVAEPVTTLLRKPVTDWLEGIGATVWESACTTNLIGPNR